MKKKILLVGLVASTLFFAGCGADEDSDKGTTTDVQITVNNLSQVNNGSVVTWDITVVNPELSGYVEVISWNDTSYFWENSDDYNDRVRLTCNDGTADCKDIDQIVCERTLLAGTYTEYECNYIADGVTYEQNQLPIRVPYSSDQDDYGTYINVMTGYEDEFFDTEVDDSDWGADLFNVDTYAIEPYPGS